MKNKWSSKEAKKYINKYKKLNINEDLALRIYTTHLLGREKNLVLHGGGNTSLKTISKNIYNKEIEVMHIKGSGWDMGSIDYPGLPAVELKPLMLTRKLKKLDDFDMVNLQRKYLLNSSSPNPSVETLLHAFLPFKYVDHTHANAILSLINQPNDFEICKKTFGNSIGIVPYVIPGFELAIKSFEIFNRNPNVFGLILLNHGIFTFGDTAQESYNRMIRLVSLTEKKLSIHSNKILTKKIVKKNENLEKISNIFLPLIRNYLSTKEKNGDITKWILDVRSSVDILKYLNHSELNQFSQRGPITPDHVIRIKPKPLIINLLNKNLNQIEKTIKDEIKRFKIYYKKYFLRNKKNVNNPVELDSNPRLIFIPGFGIIGIGRTSKESKIASDLAECTVDVISKAQSFGQFKSISEKEIFKMEYWSLEQAKLKGAKRNTLTSNVVVISGGCGAIGLATAKAFIKEGAEVILLENNINNIKKTPDDIKNSCSILKCDVTSSKKIAKSFRDICNIYGGIDVLVCNAGAPWQGAIGEVSDKTLKKSLDLNFYSHHYLSQESVKIMLQQKTGGSLLYNISKQSINPGKNFGPYGIAKAATLFLMRQYALEYGKNGIRANGVNPDRVNTDFGGKGYVAKRAKARGISSISYVTDNLLKLEVLPEDVAQAFVDLAKAKKTTGNIVTVDGGNITATLR